VHLSCIDIGSPQTAWKKTGVTSAILNRTSETPHTHSVLIITYTLPEKVRKTVRGLVLLNSNLLLPSNLVHMASGEREISYTRLGPKFVTRRPPPIRIIHSLRMGGRSGLSVTGLQWYRGSRKSVGQLMILLSRSIYKGRGIQFHVSRTPLPH
jgi:hypothetical protein